MRRYFGRFCGLAGALVALALILLAANSPPAHALGGQQNVVPQVCQGVAATAYSVNFAADVTTLPPVDIPFSVGAYLANLNLKYCPPQIVAPPTVYLRPDSTAATSDDPEKTDPQTQDPACYATVHQNTTEEEYENFLGVPLKMENWGELGTPTLYHFNTNVGVRILGPQATGNPADATLDDALPLLPGNTLKLGVGHHTLVYRADSLISPLDFVYIYTGAIPAGTPAEKAAVSGSAVLRSEVLKALSKEIGAEAAKAALAKGLGWDFTVNQLLGLPDAYNLAYQEVWVLDLIPPAIHISTDLSSLPATTRAIVSYDPTRKVYYLQAIEPGGITATDAVNLLRPLIQVHDHCNNPVTVTNDLGGAQYQQADFWPTGSTIHLTWTATDPGPSDPQGDSNSTSLVQTIVVRDTKPPVLLAPPSKVVVIPPGQTQVQVPLGDPRVYDLTDLSPTVTNNASGDTFSLGLHTVTWTASNGSNTSQAQQLIIVKTQGTNHPPVANAQTVSTLSYKDTVITLSGTDPDYYPSVKRHDPLTFSIVSLPQHGELVAPLLPFFIDDYRLEASALKFSGEEWQSNPQQYCQDRAAGTVTGPANWQIGYPYHATWMAVDDSGDTAVSDDGSAYCNPGGSLGTSQRLVIFNSEHDIIATTDLEGITAVKIFWDQRNNDIYLVDDDTQGDQYILVYDHTLKEIARYDLSYAGGNSAGKALARPIAVAVDGNGIMYVASELQVNAYRQIATSTPATAILPAQSYLGEIFSDPKSAIVDIAADSQGRLDVAELSRIYQLSPSRLDQSGIFTPGSPVGWLGRCSENLTNSYTCDTTHQISIGFSCSDSLCGRSQGIYGSGPGQFDQIGAIAIDPNDVLYVADSLNSRIERFMPDGLFGGQADSTGVGYGFMLGDFGMPFDIEVNSSHFYILDTKADLLHIFKTTPVTPIDDSHAQVTYRSTNNYVGTDSFRFAASDGLASSEANVTINVTRNFRPPSIPLAGAPITEPAMSEDASTTFTLSGTDPDGSLDTLTAVLVDPPQHGKVTFSGLTATYTPDQYYSGPDSFTYQVSDGRSLSAQTATVQLTVDPIDIPPTITADKTVSAVVGFKLAHRVDVFDPDQGDVLLVDIDWGDGSTDTTDGHFDLNGKPVPWQDAANADGTAKTGVTTTGPILDIDPTGHGSLMANHVFTRAGQYNVTSCVYDNAHLDSTTQVKSPTGSSHKVCTSTQVTVSMGASVGMQIGTPQKPVAPGTTVTLPVTITNLRFDLPAGDPRASQLPATGESISNFTFKAQAGPELKVTAARPDSGTCTVSDSTVQCDLAQLAYGAQAKLQVDVQVATDAPGAADLPITTEGDWTNMPAAATGGAYIQVVNSGAAPVLSSVSPSSGPPTGGTEVTLTGDHFDAGARVRFGTVDGTQVQVLTDGSITAFAPAQPDGTEVTMSVINPDGQTATLAQAFTYQKGQTSPTPTSSTPPPSPTPTSSSGGKGGGGAFGVISLLALALAVIGRALWLRRRRGVDRLR